MLPADYDQWRTAAPPEEKPFCQCAWCKDDIYDAEEPTVVLDDEYYCIDCFKEMTVAREFRNYVYDLDKLYEAFGAELIKAGEIE